MTDLAPDQLAKVRELKAEIDEIMGHPPRPQPVEPSGPYGCADAIELRFSMAELDTHREGMKGRGLTFVGGGPLYFDSRAGQGTPPVQVEIYVEGESDDPEATISGLILTFPEGSSLVGTAPRPTRRRPPPKGAADV